MDVYRPVIGGRPASSAYAMPCGTSSVVSTTPATMSLASHSRWYDEIARSPGTTPNMRTTPRPCSDIATAICCLDAHWPILRVR